MAASCSTQQTTVVPTVGRKLSEICAFIHAKTLTARAITSPITVREMSDWSAIVSFAQRASGMTSVGLKAVLVVTPRMR